MKVDTGEYGMIQVCFNEGIIPALEEWLASRNSYLFRIPEDDPEDIPTYAIGIKF